MIDKGLIKKDLIFFLLFRGAKDVSKLFCCCEVKMKDKPCTVSVKGTPVF